MELDLASFAVRTPASVSANTIHVLLTPLQSVDRFIADFRSRSLPLHFLINNAGVGTTAGTLFATWAGA